MKELEKLPQIIHHCMTIGELPTSYKMSLTYEEQLMWFCRFLQEEVIPVVNNNSKAVEELKTYVEAYFNNLDVQEEINNKLDDMVEQGTLQEIIAEYINLNSVLGFDDVADMKSATNLINGSFARTLGYNQLNDGLGSLYKIREITNHDTVDEDNLVSLSNENLVAEKIKNFPIHEVKIHFPSLENSVGDCSIIKMGNKTMIIDLTTDVNFELENYLISKSLTKIHYIEISHLHNDHYGNENGLNHLLSNNAFDFSECIAIMPPKPDFSRFIGNGEQMEEIDDFLVEIFENHNISIMRPTEGQIIKVDDCNSIKFLNCNTNQYSNYYDILDEYNKTSENNFSIVTEISHNEDKYLFTGDIEEIVEEYLVPLVAKTKILKVAHHGLNSDYDDYLNKINPDYSVISKSNATATNSDAVAKLRRIKTKLFMNNFSGSIIFSTNLNKLLVESENGETYENMGKGIKSGDDLNDIIENGIYYSNALTGIANAPISDTTFRLEVVQINVGRVYQILYTNSGNPQIWFRNKSGAGWSQWFLQPIVGQRGLIEAYNGSNFSISGTTQFVKIPLTNKNIDVNAFFTLDNGSVKVGKNIKLVEVMAQVTLEGGFTAGDYLMVGIYKNSSLVKRVLCNSAQTYQTLVIPKFAMFVNENDLISLQVRNVTNGTGSIATNSSQTYMQVEVKE